VCESLSSTIQIPTFLSKVKGRSVPFISSLVDDIELLIVSSMAQAANNSFASSMSLVVWVSPLPMHDNSHEFSRPAHTSSPYSLRSPTLVPMAISSPSADPMARVDFRAIPIEPSTEIKQSSHILSFPMSGQILLMSLTMS
jgi:hypothetical protein